MVCRPTSPDGRLRTRCLLSWAVPTSVSPGGGPAAPEGEGSCFPVRLPRSASGSPAAPSDGSASTYSPLATIPPTSSASGVTCQGANRWRAGQCRRADMHALRRLSAEPQTWASPFSHHPHALKSGWPTGKAGILSPSSDPQRLPGRRLEGRWPVPTGVGPPSTIGTELAGCPDIHSGPWGAGHGSGGGATHGPNLHTAPRGGAWPLAPFLTPSPHRHCAQAHCPRAPRGTLLPTHIVSLSPLLRGFKAPGPVPGIQGGWTGGEERRPSSKLMKKAPEKISGKS